MILILASDTLDHGHTKLEKVLLDHQSTGRLLQVLKL